MTKFSRVLFGRSLLVVFAPIKCIILSSFKWERNYYAASCMPTLISKLWPWPVRVAPFKRIFQKFIYLFVRPAWLALIWRQMPTFFDAKREMPIELFVHQMEHFSQRSIRQSGVSDLCNGSADVPFFFSSFSVVPCKCNSNLYAHFCVLRSALKLENATSTIEQNWTAKKSPRLEWHNEDEWLQNDIRFILNNNATTTQTSSNRLRHSRRHYSSVVRRPACSRRIVALWSFFSISWGRVAYTIANVRVGGGRNLITSRNARTRLSLRMLS